MQPAARQPLICNYFQKVEKRNEQYFSACLQIVRYPTQFADLPRLRTHERTAPAVPHQLKLSRRPPLNWISRHSNDRCSMDESADQQVPNPAPAAPSSVLSADAVPVGTPLEWPIVDADGSLLFASATVLATADEKTFLFKGGDGHKDTDHGRDPKPAEKHRRRYFFGTWTRIRSTRTGSADSVKGLRVRSSGRCAAVVARLQISPQQAVREARLPINQSVLPA